MRGLAFRRHQLEKKKARIRFIVGRIWEEPDLARDQRFVGLWARSPHPCSGYCCGNPRKWFGHKTVKEQLGDFDDQHELW